MLRVQGRGHSREEGSLSPASTCRGYPDPGGPRAAARGWRGRPGRGGHGGPSVPWRFWVEPVPQMRRQSRGSVRPPPGPRRRVASLPTAGLWRLRSLRRRGDTGSLFQTGSENAGGRRVAGGPFARVVKTPHDDKPSCGRVSVRCRPERARGWAATAPLARGPGRPGGPRLSREGHPKQRAGAMWVRAGRRVLRGLLVAYSIWEMSYHHEFRFL